MKSFLHVGCGHKNKKDLKGFNDQDWEEIRFDIDNKVAPDIVGTLTDMSSISAHAVDAVYSSHNIEHLFPHEVVIALKEFHRVLKDDGIAVITCPDLQSTCEAIVNNKLLEPLYMSPSGPIAPIDIIYGHRASIAKGNLFMAHKSGFTYTALTQVLFEAGFPFCFGGQRKPSFDLWLIAFKIKPSDDKLSEIAKQFLP